MVKIFPSRIHLRDYPQIDQSRNVQTLSTERATARYPDATSRTGSGAALRPRSSRRWIDPSHPTQPARKSKNLAHLTCVTQGTGQCLVNPLVVISRSAIRMEPDQRNRQREREVIAVFDNTSSCPATGYWLSSAVDGRQGHKDSNGKFICCPSIEPQPHRWRVFPCSQENRLIQSHMRCSISPLGISPKCYRKMS